MGYINAEEILPIEVIEILQKYVDGKNIYVPKKKDSRSAWGSGTQIRDELEIRNRMIYEEYLLGMKVKQLAERYYLSEKSIQRIVRDGKRKESKG